LELHERIKEIRKENKLSQSAFGEKLGVSRDAINNIENNRVEPKQLFVNYLCEIFKVNKDWLLTGEGDIYDVPIEDERIVKALMQIQESGNEKLKSIVEKMVELDDKYIDIILNLVDTILEDQK
jgi:transcriptional regulator with XRE-family HTH domain